MTRLLLLCLIFIYSVGAIARMYQWVDPDSGNTQLSGTPPIWYRGKENGPRVFVFNKGKIIDDTGINLPDIEQDKLRQQAFLQAEADKQRAREKLLQAKKLQAALDQKQKMDKKTQEDEEYEEELLVDLIPEQEDVSAETKPEAEGPSIDDMRDLISEWEKIRTQKARDLVNPATQ